MSVGRIEEGQLICRYHGWRFEGGQEGRCTACPQASDASAEVTVRQSSRSRLEMHPSQVPLVSSCFISMSQCPCWNAAMLAQPYMRYPLCVCQFS